MEIKTFKIRSGRNVLAKETKNGLMPVSYANTTQANKKAAELKENQINCHVTVTYPFYIIID